MQTQAKLHDGTTIGVEVRGQGPSVLLPVRTAPREAAEAEAMERWGAEADLGANLVAGLADRFRVVAFDYEGHRMQHPAAETLTPDAIAFDLLSIADAAAAESFAYYGYSWLALCGLQLAMRTDRTWAVAMGGFPPVDGPYGPMLAVTRAAHARAGEPPAPDAEVGDWESAGVQADADQTGQFVVLYEALQPFDDAAALPALHCPRLCFAGDNDVIQYGPGWGDVTVDIVGPLLRRGAELRAAGWDVVIVRDGDHQKTMRSDIVLPVLRPWLERAAA